MKSNCKVVALSLLMGLSGFFIGCSGGNKSNSSTVANGNGDNQTTQAQAPAKYDSLTDKGIGPVSSVSVGEINDDSADKGKTVFSSKCSACHKIDSRLVGPALKGVTKRRTPEWIMNQILNPAEQIQKDSLGKILLARYMTQMTFQNVTQAEARDILEYFREIDAGKEK